VKKSTARPEIEPAVLNALLCMPLLRGSISGRARRIFHNLSVFVLLSTAAFLTIAPAHGKTFRWTSQADILTTDPHAQNEGLTISVMNQIYEALVRRDRNWKLVPELAVSWTTVSPTVWRFKLRPGVKFHDGQPFTADDVVFSLNRAMAPTSNFKSNIAGIKTAKKVDNLTVDISTNAPNPLVLAQLSTVRIMSHPWAIQHKAVEPQNFSAQEETYASRNTNGTGPLMLKSREPDVKTVLTASPNWWGKRESNVTEVLYLPIKSDATRIAALVSGEVDFVLDPSPQDVARLKSTAGTKIVEGPENRVIFLGFDQYRDELTYSSIKGENPFKDLRVRLAVYHAIDVETINKKIMRGLAVPTGSLVAAQVNGYSAAAADRPPFDPAQAKTLLADAGYPNGFQVTLDCPNNRYIRDEEVCQAIAAMLARIGIEVKLNALPRVQFFPKVQKNDTSFYLVGILPTTHDAWSSLFSIAHSQGWEGGGDWNLGRYANPKLDTLIDAIHVEMNPSKRNKLIEEALLFHNADVAHVPLYQQMTPWATRANVRVVHTPDNFLELRWVNID
jgi:peptide/nickel transport system substrate-binding protein